MLSVRSARPDDVATLVAFIQKKAAFDREVGAFDGAVVATAASLTRFMFGAPTLAHGLLLEDGGTPRGFAFYYFRFSSFAGRPSLWLDDLYVDVEHRRGGAGTLLMRRLAGIALAHDCTHLAWTADDRNRAGVTFYRKLGAEVVNHQQHSLTWRIAPDVLAERAAVAGAS